MKVSDRASVEMDINFNFRNVMRIELSEDIKGGIVKWEQ